ncbi:MAG: ABC transporter ATP-binding protein [Candidatus Njordarchaeia archaeon]
MDSIISLENVVKEFDGIYALNGLTLEFKNGINGFLGPNGAGKSTTLMVLMGLIKPDAGRVSVLGFDPVRESLKVREHLGFLPEFDVLDLDIEADKFIVHMGMISGLSREEAVKQLNKLSVFLALGEEMRRPLKTLSHGMKQKAKLAIAMISDPDILLLDEPTAGLDPLSRDRMLELIKILNEEMDKSIVLSTHLLNDVEAVCDYVVIINEGKVIGAGWKRELLDKLGKKLVVKITESVDPVNEKVVKILNELGHRAYYDEDENKLYVLPKDRDFKRAKKDIIEVIATEKLPLVQLTEKIPTFEEIFEKMLGEGNGY